MFDIGGPEFLLLLVIALLVFGPRQMARYGKQAGTFAGKLRRSWREVRQQLEQEVAIEDLQQAHREIKGLRADARSIARNLTQVPTPRDLVRTAITEQSSKPPTAEEAEESNESEQLEVYSEGLRGTCEESRLAELEAAPQATPDRVRETRPVNSDADASSTEGSDT